MPIYEYECQQCHQRFETLVRNANDRPDCCPACGSTHLEKQWATFGIPGGTASAAGSDGGSCACGGGTCCV